MSEHPTADQLAALASGQLAGAAARSVASHLNICERCAVEAAISRKLFELDESGLLPELTTADRTAAVATIRRLSPPTRPASSDRGQTGGGSVFGVFGLLGGAVGLGAAAKAGDASHLAPPFLAAAAQSAHSHLDPADHSDSNTIAHAGPEAVGGDAGEKSDARPVRTAGDHPSGGQEETFPGLAELEAMFAEALAADPEAPDGTPGPGSPTAEGVQEPWGQGHAPSGDGVQKGLDLPGDHADWLHEPDAHDDHPDEGPHDPPAHDHHTDGI